MQRELSPTLKKDSSMKKVILLIVSVVLLLSSCSSDDSHLPSGHADWLRYENSSTNTHTLEDVDFEYVNENTIKITKANGDILYIDSSRLYYIDIRE